MWASTDALGKGQTFTGYFFVNIFSSIPGIIEYPVIKIAFRNLVNFEFTVVGCNDRRWICRRWSCGVNFYLGSCWNYIFFWNWDFRVDVLLMMLLKNFIWWSMWPFFFGMVPLVSLLLDSAFALFVWECLGGLMLYSTETSSWSSSYTSVCGWQLHCVEIFWRSGKSWSSKSW